MNRPGKVYVITKGSYSDYHICMVTMDRNRAEKSKKLLDDEYEKANIEEYILDETKETGRVYYIEFRDDESVEVHIDEYENFKSFDLLPYIDDLFSDKIRIYVRAKDEDHALKIAQDEHAKWKAEKEGIV